MATLPPDWETQLQQGSFRGVEFDVLGNVTSRIGRRSIANEIPGSDTVLQQDDLGRKARRFHVSCCVIGSDYMEQRDALRDALEEEGPGTLIHPFWGKRQAVVDGDVQIVESTEAGGMASFEIDFVEIPATDGLTIPPDPTADFLDSAQDVVAAINDALSTNWVAKGLSAMHLATIAGYVNTALEFIQGVQTQIGSVFGLVDDFESKLQDVLSAVTSLVVDPVELALSLTGLVTQISDTVSAIADAETQAGRSGSNLAGQTVALDTDTSATCSSLASSASTGDTTSSTSVPLTSGATGSAQGGASGPSGGPPAVDGRLLSATLTLATQLASWTRPLTTAETLGATVFTPSQQAEIDCGTALQRLINVSGVVAACRAIPNVPFASGADALALRTTLMDLLDQVELELVDDETFLALEVLRINATNFLTQVAANLPNVVTFTPRKTIPCLVIAHNVYGDASREQEIIDRNDIQNPSAVTGGVPLEVLDA